jgi:hypothetical protein
VERTAKHRQGAKRRTNRCEVGQRKEELVVGIRLTIEKPEVSQGMRDDPRAFPTSSYRFAGRGLISAKGWLTLRGMVMGPARARHASFQFIPLSEQVIMARAEIGEEIQEVISRDGGRSWTVDGSPEVDVTLIKEIAEAYKHRVAHLGH